MRGKFQDLSGMQFGRWTVILRRENQGKHSCFLCICECGTERTVCSKILLSGQSQSCGCYCSEINSKLKTKHGKRKFKEYDIWRQMIQRCYNENNKCYKDYGARGITVCDRWKNSVSLFIEDMGERPLKHTLERSNNDLGYFKDNCYWATRKVQSNNTRRNVFYAFNGESKTLPMWSEIIGIKERTLYARINYYGFSIEEAFTTKIDIHAKKKKRINI